MKLLGFLLLLILQVALWREGAGAEKRGGRGGERVYLSISGMNAVPVSLCSRNGDSRRPQEGF